MTDNQFDWMGDSGIVIHEQPAIAVYRNERGQVVIRQRDVLEDRDDVIHLNLKSVAILTEAIVKATYCTSSPVA